MDMCVCRDACVSAKPLLLLGRPQKKVKESTEKRFLVSWGPPIQVGATGHVHGDALRQHARIPPSMCVFRL